MKPKGTIRIEGIELSDFVNILNMPTLESLTALQSRNDYLLETENDYFLLKHDVVFRFVKPRAKPRILKTSEIIINPDSFNAKVTLSSEELLDFALMERIPVFETKNQFIIPSSIMLVAEKKAKEVERK